jgi:hypothetical protein
MSNIINENICPFCKSSNNCMAHSDNPCWCIEANVPNGLIDLLPSEYKGKACICSTCISDFNTNSDVFVERLLHLKH